MSDLYAIGYPDAAKADAVRDKLIELNKQQLIDLADAVVVENEKGKIKLHQAQNTTAAGAAGGALWGGLIGLLFLAPLLGMAVGAGFGALGGKMADVGIDDKFMKDVGERLPEGGAALFLLVRGMTEDKVLAEIAPMGGQLIRSSLSSEDEDHMRRAVADARANAHAGA